MARALPRPVAAGSARRAELAHLVQIAIAAPRVAGLIADSDAVPGGAVFVMETTAHHQDLRLPTPKDPPELTKVRADEEAIIRRWIAEAVAN